MALRATLTVVGAIATVAALREGGVGLAWVFATWGLVFTIEAVAGRSSLRFLFINAAAAMATLAVAEQWWARVESAPRERPQVSTIHDPPYKRFDPVLGYAPIPSMTAAARLVKAGRLVYDVRYSIDERGLRVAPPCDCGPETRSILFFGCSFTYGEGVADEETLPYRVGVHTAGRYAVYNFGFQGYGPHQMLAALERGLVADKVVEAPRYAIYSAIADHVRRAAGAAPWDTYLGPRYVRDGDGVRNAGPFINTAPPPPRGAFERFAEVLARSAIVRRLRPELGDEDATETFAAIVEAAGQRLEADFPGIEFRVLLWGLPTRYRRDLASRLERRGLNVTLIADVLPDFAARRRQYRIRDDSHPNADAYDRVARYLAERVIGPD